MYRFRDIYVYAMYYVYVTSGPSPLIESTDSMMILFFNADKVPVGVYVIVKVQGQGFIYGSKRTESEGTARGQGLFTSP